MFARLFFCVSRAIGTRVRERGVRVCDAQDACCERNLLAAECVRVARAVPPLLMPADQKLCAAIRTGARRLLLSDDRMARKVQSLFFRQIALALYIVALHCGFAQIMRERGD